MWDLTRPGPKARRILLISFRVLGARREYLCQTCWYPDWFLECQPVRARSGSRPRAPEEQAQPRDSRRGRSVSSFRGAGAVLERGGAKRPITTLHRQTTPSVFCQRTQCSVSGGSELSVRLARVGEFGDMVRTVVQGRASQTLSQTAAIAEARVWMAQARSGDANEIVREPTHAQLSSASESRAAAMVEQFAQAVLYSTAREVEHARARRPMEELESRLGVVSA
eukprot:11187730-Lingulodinium_polyedra.AAC.3